MLEEVLYASESQSDMEGDDRIRPLVVKLKHLDPGDKDPLIFAHKATSSLKSAFCSIKDT